MDTAFDNAMAQAQLRLGRKLTVGEASDLRTRTPNGSLSGVGKDYLEAIAWTHLFGLVLALKRGRCLKALKNLQAAITTELAKGPLEAHGYAHEGYGAITAAIGRVTDHIGVYSGSWTPYRGAIGDYTHTASYFWYHLQHLTDNPAYRDQALVSAERELLPLFNLEP